MTGGRDALGLARALPDRSVIAVILSMTVLAGLALGGASAAQSLARAWLGDGRGTVMIELPGGDQAGPRAEAIAKQAAGLPGIVAARVLPHDEETRLLAPWLGGQDAAAALPADTLPALVEVTRADNAPQTDLAGAIAHLAPDAVVAEDRAWVSRLTRFAASVQASALAIVALVATTAAIMIGVAVRGALRARRGPVAIAHDLGAPDGYIAGIIARRGLVLGLAGGVPGALLAWAALRALALVAAPLASDTAADVPFAFASWRDALLPTPLMATLAALPVIASLLTWATTQGSVRLWLRRLS